MLGAIGEIPGIRRVRFTTSHPRDFARDIIEAIDAVPTLCDHVHLPVQSGSTRVLDAMQRQYTRDQYLERIAWMKAAKREISMTTDMIVGFPGETEADFAETLSLLRSGVRRCLRIQIFSASQYSIDQAWTMPSRTKTNRGACRVLMTRQREIQTANYKKYIGTDLEVMVEGHNETRGQWIGPHFAEQDVEFHRASLCFRRLGATCRCR